MDTARGPSFETPRFAWLLRMTPSAAPQSTTIFTRSRVLTCACASSPFSTPKALGRVIDAVHAVRQRFHGVAGCT